MDIEFKNNKLKKRCEVSKEARRAYGPDNEKRLVQRINELQAAENLQDLYKVPAAGLHPLKGKRKGQFAVYLCQPARLVFEPIGENIDFEDLRTVRAVRILEIVDYH